MFPNLLSDWRKKNWKFRSVRADPKINLFMLKAEINLIQKGGKSLLPIVSIVMFDRMGYIQKMLPSPFFILISFFVSWSEKISDLVKPRLFNSILVYCEDRKNADLDTSWKDINKKKSRSINFYYYTAARTISWKKTLSLRICSRKICANDKAARG